MMWEAFICLAWARLLKLLPFAKIAPSLGSYMEETEASHEARHHQTIRDVAQAIHTMSRYTLWESQCLVQAIAAQNMLTRRGIASTLYLGTAKGEQGQLTAHAWLRSGDVYVTGAQGMHRFVVVSKFAKRLETKKKSRENVYG